MFRGTNTHYTFINKFYSAASLKVLFQTERSYLNLVSFNNILTDIIIYFITKEGRKMLKGIKTLFLDCLYKGGEHIITVNLLDTMRSSLFIFITYYNELIYIILENIPRSSRYTMKVSEINVLMKKTLNHLENVKKEFVNNCNTPQCEKIITQLEFLRHAYRGSRPDKLKFKQHYFLRPVLTIYKLYVYTLLYVN